MSIVKKINAELIMQKSYNELIVMEILMDVLKCDGDDVTFSTTLTDSNLGINSYDVIEILFEIESKFNIEMETMLFEECETVGDLCDLVNSIIFQ